MSATLLDAAMAALVEMDAVSKAFGAPGDYGYSSKEGKALFSLSRARYELANAIDGLPIGPVPGVGNMGWNDPGPGVEDPGDSMPDLLVVAERARQEYGDTGSLSDETLESLIAAIARASY